MTHFVAQMANKIGSLVTAVAALKVQNNTQKEMEALKDEIKRLKQLLVHALQKGKAHVITLRLNFLWHGCR